jgi:muconate cycloisomerase
LSLQDDWAQRVPLLLGLQRTLSIQERSLMRIRSVEAFLVALPTQKPPRRPSPRGPGAIAVIVKVHGEGGLVGLGEAPVLLPRGGNGGRHSLETGTTVCHIIRDHLSSILTERDIFDIEGIHQAMDEAVGGHPYAKASIDCALYDLMGKALGVPVYQLLGGLAREWVPLAHRVGLMESDLAAAEAYQAVQEGVGAIKLRVGVRAETDPELVALVREAVGPQVYIMVDAHQGYRTPKEALRALKAMEAHGVRFAEEPVPGWEAMAQVAANLSIPVVADESAWTAQDVLEVSRIRAADLVSLQPIKPGGLWPARQMAAVATAAGLACTLEASAETGVGNAANLHLAASLACVTEACVLPVTTRLGEEQTQVAGRFYTDDIIQTPFEYKEGRLRVPGGPGLGVELDEERVSRYRVL